MFRTYVDIICALKNFPKNIGSSNNLKWKPLRISNISEQCSRYLAKPFNVCVFHRRGCQTLILKKRPDNQNDDAPIDKKSLSNFCSLLIDRYAQVGEARSQWSEVPMGFVWKNTQLPGAQYTFDSTSGGSCIRMLRRCKLAWTALSDVHNHFFEKNSPNWWIASNSFNISTVTIF